MGALNLIPVDDLDDPRLLPYRNQRDAWLRAAHNPRHAADSHAEHLSAAAPPDPLFMAEGILVIRALLASPFRPHSVLATPQRFAAIEHDLRPEHADLPVFLAAPALMERIVGFDIHRGLLAAAHRPPPLRPQYLLANARILVLAENLSNHDNLGGLFRTLAALVGPGSGVLLSPRCCDPLYRKALRVSMGHALSIPFATLSPWPDALADVSRAGFQILALTTPGLDDLPESEYRPMALTSTDRVALLVGAEGPGLSSRTLERLADPALNPPARRVSIPMACGVDSLNLVVALGIVLDRVRSALNLRHNPPVSRTDTPPGG